MFLKGKKKGACVCVFVCVSAWMPMGMVAIVDVISDSALCELSVIALISLQMTLQWHLISITMCVCVFTFLYMCVCVCINVSGCL